MLLTFFSFVLVITSVVIPHELGHYLMSLRAGIRPLEFGVGFPPRVFSIKGKRTIFSLNLIPIGGFLRVAGMNPESESEDDNYSPVESYAAKGPLDKALVILGGPLMNLIFAFLLLTLLFGVFGQPAGVSNELASVLPGSPAEGAGLKVGDRITKINGMKISGMEDAVKLIHKSPGKTITLELQRGGTTSTVSAVPRLNEKMGVALLGFSLKPFYKRSSLPEAVWLGFTETGNLIKLVLFFLFMLLTGRAGLSEIAGPVGIAQFTGQAARGGIEAFIGFAAFVSVNLGIVNLLPLPALDGGRVVIIAIEKIVGRPLDLKTENRIHSVGMVVLLCLAALLTANDVMRWLVGR